MMRAMEKLKHLDPKFSYSIERLAKRIKYSGEGSLSKRPRTKTAGRFHRKANNNDDTTEHNRDFYNDHDLSQDKTEYIAKQSDVMADAIDIGSNSYFDQEFDKLSKLQFPADDSYNLKATGKKVDDNCLEKVNLNNRRNSFRKPVMGKLPKSNFKVIEQTALKDPNLNEQQRKEMITVLRNNSKILTQQEKSLNSKMRGMNKQDDHSRSQALLQDNRMNLGDYMRQGDLQKITDSGSKGR